MPIVGAIVVFVVVMVSVALAGFWLLQKSSKKSAVMPVSASSASIEVNAIAAPLPTLPVTNPPVGKKRRNNALWPKIVDASSARFAARQAMAAAFFCAGFTMLFVLLSRAGVLPVQSFNQRPIVDAAVFAFLGFAILRMSRIASVAALVLYVVERIAAWDTITVGPQIVMVAVLLLCFVNGIRGAFAYQRYRDPSD